MTRRAPGRVTGIILTSGAVVALMIAPARAVSPASETLFQEGRRLITDGRVAEACARFSESYALEASSGTLLNLALCHQKLGKTATALAEYRGAARLARDQGREDRAAAAAQKVAELEPTVPRLTFVCARPVPGLLISSDGGTLPEGEVGVPIPIDPGPHEVTVSAPGRRPWTIALEIKEEERRTVEIPALEIEPARLPATIVEPVAARPSPATNRLDVAPGAPRSRVEQYLVAGSGILIVGGGALFSAAVAKFSSAEDACDTNPGCGTSERNGRVATIQRLEEAAYGAWLAGGALLISAAAHHFHWVRKAGAPTIATAAPLEGAAGVSLGGAF